ncbi:oxidoreductase [[Haemophilus] ducreyi]|uniref:FAD-dependent monooxygenase n=1 Tax=Haemophilus ducreyi TaxID=730 RepID=UPI0006554F63|nr:FAD-dependent monooxygenase [[Haemophilus] ducreyi]AKO40862.1 oxidoreductase [[Haemophilus] ducreyi]
MKSADLIIIGGGMVGLALAGLLKDSPCQIKIIEKSAPKTQKYYANRVSAINTASEKMLQQLGVFEHIPTDAYTDYQKIIVSEKDSFAKIEFDNNDLAIKQLGLTQLGLIIANSQLQQALWQQVSQQKNVEIILSTPKTIGISESGAFLTLENGEMLAGKLVVGADGAHSWLRNQINIPLISQDYQQTALVCCVETAEPHNNIARQIFGPDSILAFLPLADKNQCSIVWSLPPDQANKLTTCDEQQFNQALTIAFDYQLGLVKLQDSRKIYPLTARYARDFAQMRIALIGDAAHTIHPLAGLGVNLGFADAITLAEQIKLHLAAAHDIGEYRHLRYFERTRKTETIKLLAAMEGLKQLFSGNNPLKKLIRGIGLVGTNHFSAIKKRLRNYYEKINHH